MSLGRGCGMRGKRSIGVELCSLQPGLKPFRGVLQLVVVVIILEPLPTCDHIGLADAGWDYKGKTLKNHRAARETRAVKTYWVLGLPSPLRF